MSLKDQSLYNHLESLCELGVHSLKIEGRMKRPEYVAAATAVLRCRLDGGTPDTQLLDDLQAVFSRSGFTDGYYTGRRTAEMFGSRRSEDVAAPAVLSRLARLFDKETPRVPVTVSLQDAPLTVTATDTEGNSVSVQASPETPVLEKALDPERVAVQLVKTGGTPFAATVGETAAPHVPLSSVNQLRREALEALASLRGKPCAVPYEPKDLTKPLLTGALRGLVARVERAEQVIDGADSYIVPLGCTPSVPHWGVEIPRGLFGREEAVLRRLAEAKNAGATFALCNNVGAVPLAVKAGLSPVAGAFWNITNSESLAAAAEDGAEAAIVSFELTFPQMRFAENAGCTGLFAYGRQPLMLLRNCPVSAVVGCSSCHGDRHLVDRTGTKFPVRCTEGCSELLNSVPLYLADRLSELPRVPFLYLHFTDETPEQVTDTLKSYRTGGVPTGAFTRGLYKRGVE